MNYLNLPVDGNTGRYYLRDMETNKATRNAPRIGSVWMFTDSHGDHCTAEITGSPIPGNDLVPVTFRSIDYKPADRAGHMGINLFRRNRAVMVKA